MAAQMAGGEIVTLEIGPGGIQALEQLWAEDVKRDPFTEPKGRRRTMTIDAKRQPLRAVEDEDELVAAGHVDPTHVPLPLWAGAEALAGFSHFRAGTREGVLGGDWWEATLDHLRGTLERCDNKGAAEMIVLPGAPLAALSRPANGSQWFEHRLVATGPKQARLWIPG